MAKSKLVVNMTLKRWAKPAIFILCFIGLKSLIRKWMFIFKVTSA